VSRREPFRAVRGRHPDVDDGQVRTVLADQVQQLRGITRLADHLEAGPLEQADYPLADQHVVVGHDNTAAAHGHVVDMGGLGGAGCRRGSSGDCVHAVSSDADGVVPRLVQLTP
jgi:hypothetical protein